MKTEKLKEVITKCKHLWIKDNDEVEVYYCQKCLRQIKVLRWKDTTEIIDLDKGRKLKEIESYW